MAERQRLHRRGRECRAEGFGRARRHNPVMGRYQYQGRFRKGGGVSDQQWKDVQGVLKVKRDTLHRDYVLRQAETLGVAKLAQRAFAEADTEP